MALFSDSQLTAKGHALLSKVLAGRCKFKFTLIQAGDGHFTGDVLDLTGLVNHRLDGKIVGIREMGMFTELDCYLSNQNLTAFLEFREVGIRADDPDEGSIMFSYANAGEFASPMGPFNGVWLHEEIFTMRVYTANATDIRAEITPTAFATEIAYNNKSSGLMSDNVQDAIDELAQKFNSHINETVSSAGGVHGIRFYNGLLEVFDGEKWTVVTGQGNTRGFRVIDGVLSNTVPFGEVTDSTLVFKDGFVVDTGETLKLD